MDGGGNRRRFTDAERCRQLGESREFSVSAWRKRYKMIALDRGGKAGGLLRVGDFSDDVAGNHKSKPGMGGQESAAVDGKEIHQDRGVKDYIMLQGSNHKDQF